MTDHPGGRPGPSQEPHEWGTGPTASRRSHRVDVGGCTEPETTTGPAERAVRRSGSKCRWLLCSGQRCFGCSDWAADALPALIGSSGCSP